MIDIASLTTKQKHNQLVTTAKKLKFEIGRLRKEAELIRQVDKKVTKQLEKSEKTFEKIDKILDFYQTEIDLKRK